MVLIRSYSSGVRLCLRTNSGVTAGSVMEISLRFLFLGRRGLEQDAAVRLGGRAKPNDEVVNFAGFQAKSGSLGVVLQPFQAARRLLRRVRLAVSLHDLIARREHPQPLFGAP